MHEKQMHHASSYITLTWDDEHLPSKSLTYRPYQLFMRRLRKRQRRLSKGEMESRSTPTTTSAGHAVMGLRPIPQQIRFYMCGEYGEQCRNCGANADKCKCGAWTPGPGRPHYHALLFGIDFNDKQFFTRNAQKDPVYTSATLQKLWPYGFSTVGEVTFQSAAYIARYIVKKINGQLAPSHYSNTDFETGEIIEKKPEFTHMSLKPGIGLDWLVKFKNDVYPHGKVVVNGTETAAPRYYDRKYKEWHPEDARDLAEQRAERAYAQRHDNTPERLAVKEAVTLARSTKLRRKL